MIGAGEIAISDHRGVDHNALELSKLVRDTHVGGLLAGRLGATHFHVGEEDTRLAFRREIVDRYKCRPEWLYPTHAGRNERLLDEAVALARQGATVDLDTVDEQLARWFRYYADRGGPLDRLTASPNADSGSPDLLSEQPRGLVVRHDVPLDVALPLVTTSVARVLQLPAEGRLAEGCEADVVVRQRGGRKCAWWSRAAAAWRPAATAESLRWSLGGAMPVQDGPPGGRARGLVWRGTVREFEEVDDGARVSAAVRLDVQLVRASDDSVLWQGAARGA